MHLTSLWLILNTRTWPKWPWMASAFSFEWTCSMTKKSSEYSNHSPEALPAQKLRPSRTRRRLRRRPRRFWHSASKTVTCLPLPLTACLRRSSAPFLTPKGIMRAPSWCLTKVGTTDNLTYPTCAQYFPPLCLFFYFPILCTNPCVTRMPARATVEVCEVNNLEGVEFK